MPNEKAVANFSPMFRWIAWFGYYLLFKKNDDACWLSHYGDSLTCYKEHVYQ